MSLVTKRIHYFGLIEDTLTADSHSALNLEFRRRLLQDPKEVRGRTFISMGSISDSGMIEDRTENFICE